MLEQWLNFEFYQGIFAGYWWHGMFFVLYLGAILYLSKHGDSLSKQIFVWPFVISLFTIFNPVIMEQLLRYVEGLESRFTRFFWILPVEILCAYLLACLIEKKQRMEERFGVIVMILCFFFLCGEKATQLELDDNIYKLDSSVIEVAEMIKQVSEEEQSVVFYDEPLYYWIRQYDASLIAAVKDTEMNKYRWIPKEDIDPKAQYKSETRALSMFVRGVEIDPEIVNEAIESREVDFFVRNKNEYSNEYLQQLNIEYVDEVENYELYRCIRK